MNPDLIAILRKLLEQLGMSRQHLTDLAEGRVEAGTAGLSRAEAARLREILNNNQLKETDPVEQVMRTAIAFNKALEDAERAGLFVEYLTAVPGELCHHGTPQVGLTLGKRSTVLTYDPPGTRVMPSSLRESYERLCSGKSEQPEGCQE